MQQQYADTELSAFLKLCQFLPHAPAVGVGVGALAVGTGASVQISAEKKQLFRNRIKKDLLKTSANDCSRTESARLRGGSPCLRAVHQVSQGGVKARRTVW